MILLIRDDNFYRVYAGKYMRIVHPIKSSDPLEMAQIYPLPYHHGFFAVNGSKRDFDLVKHSVSFEEPISYASMIRHYKPQVIEHLDKQKRVGPDANFDSDFYFVQDHRAFILKQNGVVERLEDLYFRGYTDLAQAVFLKHESSSVEEKVRYLFHLYADLIEAPLFKFLGYNAQTESIIEHQGDHHAD